MIEQPTKIGNSELYTARVLNMGVAKYFSLVKEYSEILTQAREAKKQDLEKNGEQAELTLYFSVRKKLNKLVLEKLIKDKITHFGANTK